jgi:hypothetical protein
MASATLTSAKILIKKIFLRHKVLNSSQVSN